MVEASETKGIAILQRPILWKRELEREDGNENENEKVADRKDDLTAHGVVIVGRPGREGEDEHARTKEERWCHGITCL